MPEDSDSMTASVLSSVANLATCISIGENVPVDDIKNLYATVIAQHALATGVCEKYRVIRAGCYGTAKDEAGGKPVSEQALERAVIAKYGIEIVEEYKSAYHRGEAMEMYAHFLSDLLKP